MRLAIMSDVHLGYGSGTELSGDPFDAFREALGKSLGCDLILLAGDLFDNRSPSTETLTRSMELLINPLAAGNGTVINRGMNKDVGELTPLHRQGIPVAAIHGTHERRVRGLINPVQALEKAGFLIYLHCNGVVFEKDGEKVCVQGMSGVPEQFSGAVLDRWGPEPARGCFNVFMMHQSVSPFMYADHLLDVEKLPKGFDLYILGHVHEGKKAEYSGSPLIIPGSLVTTQLTRDSTGPRGFWIFDTRTREAAFIALETQRRFYYMEHEGSQEELNADIERLLESRHDKKPLIRIKSGGIDVQDLNMRFGDRSILSVRKKERDRPPEAVGIQEHKLSVRELGSKLLRENLQKEELDSELFEGVFDLLAHGKSGDALRLLRPQRQHKQDGD